jgi:hypothetical protein
VTRTVKLDTWQQSRITQEVTATIRVVKVRAAVARDQFLRHRPHARRFLHSRPTSVVDNGQMRGIILSGAYNPPLHLIVFPRGTICLDTK